MRPWGETSWRRNVQGAKRPVTVRHNGPSSGPLALCRRRALPPTLPFTAGHLIAGRARSEDEGPDDSQEMSLFTLRAQISRRKFECLTIAKSLFFYFSYYTISISKLWDRKEETGTLTPGQSRRDQRNKIAVAEAIGCPLFTSAISAVVHIDYST